jgi:DNA-binding NarL/FixJ family response regulator
MQANESTLRILIADDSELMRAGMRSLLPAQSGWIVCGEATDGIDAVEKAVTLKPDVVLVDISMPHLNGLEVARRIHEQVPESEILIVTELDSRSLAHLPPQPGVRGYVMKSRITRDLVPAIEAASKHQALPNSALSEEKLPLEGRSVPAAASRK